MEEQKKEELVAGDGTNGEDTKEIMSIIKSCRRIVTYERSTVDTDANFEAGDLVYDIKHEEHGVILGKKPEIVCIEAGTDQNGDFVVEEDGPYGAIYVVLTLSRTDAGLLKTRVRYTGTRFLRLIMDDRVERRQSDLDWHCSMECVSQCCDLCSLQKHKRIRDPKD